MSSPDNVHIFQARKPIVLMVDDDDMTRMMGMEYLSQSGFKTFEASDGQAALDIMDKASPDIILMDVEMPGMDGYAACAAIRRLSAFRSVPILMLTGLDDAESITLAYEAGATDFATKPVNWPLLCHRLRYMLRSNRAIVELEQSRISLAASQRISRLGSWVWSADSDATTWSDQLYSILGKDRQGTTPDFAHILKLVHQDDRVRVANWHERACQSESTAPIDHRIIYHDGSERHLRQQIELERDSKGRVVRVQAAVQDVTENHRAETKIHELAYYDGLTRLPNRSLFAERLDLALELARRYKRQLAVMFIDMDDFKRVNDTLGHNSGDLLLRTVGHRLQSCVKSGDLLNMSNTGSGGETVARMGGDEFTILLPEITGMDEATDVAQSILDSLSQSYDLSGNEVYSTPSVGIALFPEHGDTAGDLLKNADMAMYFAKREGKNIYKTFEPSMNDVSMVRFSMESQLRKAMQSEELSLVYQPQMNLLSGELDAVEALLRWNNVELGNVSPADFIPLAEETGLIVPIGEWVLRTACLQASEWREQGLLLTRIAVNISVLQFVRPDFPNVVQTILEETGLDPSALELEITESVLAKDTTGAVSTLRRLKEIGVQLSIDDFGTGYSSLSQLKHFPIDRLKIDQSFVSGVTTNRHDAAITKAVLAMASSMELMVVAEGVETQEQLSFLEGNHCDEVQGYFLSRPLPPEQVESTLREAQEALIKRGKAV